MGLGPAGVGSAIAGSAVLDSAGFTVAGSGFLGVEEKVREVSSTTACAAEASPVITLLAPPKILAVPVMASSGSLPARIVSVTVSLICARIPVGAARSPYLLSRNST